MPTIVHMVETRAAPRYRVTKPAQIEHGGEKVMCTVRDLSVTGASLEVTDPTVIPANFTLVVPEDGLKLSCRIVRRTDFRIGVAFD
jgi:PilZ domain